MKFAYDLRDEASREAERVGGKAANLSILTAAGFPVPQGFVVAADAYSGFLEGAGLRSRIEEILRAADLLDTSELDRRCAQIRDLIMGEEVPREVSAEIVTAYERLGAEPHVAVRSSGIKEDGAAASFAGLHDTFLDVRGTPAVLSAVRGCWASLWTARAVSYRQMQRVNHFESPIAVVVQEMVRSEISGVMYTAHPVTTATDEIVINAGYGLGEAVVSSAVDPDTYVVKTGSLRTKERILGGKEIRIVRNPDGPGTITESVPEPDRARQALSEEQIRKLSAMGRRVQEHYRGFPQDIEWAYSEGQFFLVQTRPLTGVEFSWDADVDEHIWDTEDDDDFHWTRDLADEAWNGAVTPLFYSLRAPTWVAGHQQAARLWGYPEIAETRFFKFHKGEAYYNCLVEKLILENTLPPPLRPFHPSGLTKLPPEWRDETLNAPFSYWGLVKQYARIAALQPQFYEAFKIWDWYIYSDEMNAAARGLTDAELRDLSDVELKNYVERQLALEIKYVCDVWTAFYIHCRDMIVGLSYLVENWYDGDTAEAIGGLLTGVAKKTKTLEANHALWQMSKSIAGNPALVKAYKDYQGAKFFDVLENIDGGPELLEQYRSFVEEYGHRGHSDRDIIFKRRCEDPGLDYNALRPMLSGVLDDGPRMVDPQIREAEVTATRIRTTEAVVQNIRAKPLGGVKVEIFRAVLDYCHRFIEVRDNERHWLDIVTFSIRRGYLEMNRRLVDRGWATSDRDAFFLARWELYDWFLGRADQPLIRAKIAARMRDWDSFDQKKRQPPMYLHRGQGLDLDSVEQEGNTLRGMGTARGAASGVARVILSLDDIGRVRHGDVLVVNSTDPGWTPVFGVISGIVLETGGITAHGAMLAREYGLPAVQLPNATRLIADGGSIEINGETGLVVLCDAGDVATAAPPDGSQTNPSAPRAEN